MLLESSLKIRGWVLFLAWAGMPFLAPLPGILPRQAMRFLENNLLWPGCLVIAFMVLSDMLVFRQLNAGVEHEELYRGGILLRLKTATFLFALMIVLSSPSDVVYAPAWVSLTLLGGPVLLAIFLPPLTAVGLKAKRFTARS